MQAAIRAIISARWWPTFAAAAAAARPSSSASCCGRKYSVLGDLPRLATSMRPRPCSRDSSTQRWRRSCALTIRPRTYSASPRPPSAAASSSADPGRRGPAPGSCRCSRRQPSMSPRGKNRLPRRKWMRACSAVSPCADGRRLGPLQVGEGPVQVVGDPLDRREPDPGPAPLGVARRRGQRALVGAARRPACRRGRAGCRPGGSQGEPVGAARRPAPSPRSTRRSASS